MDQDNDIRRMSKRKTYEVIRVLWSFEVRTQIK